MFRLFKKKDTKPISKATEESEVNDSLDIHFSFDALPNEKIYLANWLKNDGDSVEKGHPLYRIQIGERLGVGIAFKSQPLKAEKSGIVQFLKKEGEEIHDNSPIYTLHPIGRYDFENTPSKKSYKFYFDKFEFNTSKKHPSSTLRILKWHKEDGEKVNENELVITFEYTNSNVNSEILNHYAEKDGYLDKERMYPGSDHEKNDLLDLDQNELIYLIHEKDTNRVERKFVNTPNIINDDFINKKIIKWKTVGNPYGYSEGVTTKSIDNKINFTFSLNNIEDKDFIIFQFYSKEIMLSKDDIISFLFNDNKIIDFKIDNGSYKSSHQYIDKLFENKIRITQNELDTFETQQFLKWKITLKNKNREIIGGEEGYKTYLSHNNLAAVIRKFTKEYRELVKQTILNYEPLQQRENLIIDNQDIKSEECYVYLMIDTVNNFHKIGISNSPKWREKTLQSEKPSIELIASKKFVSRQIASSIEKALHSTFKDKRLRGEWFQLDPKDIEEIKITLTT